MSGPSVFKIFNHISDIKAKYKVLTYYIKYGG